MTKPRVPVQASPDFRKMLKDLQRKVRSDGGDISLRDLTEEITKSPIISDELEKRILRKKNLNINLRFDGGMI